MNGIPATIFSIALLAVLGVAVVVGARYARHKGKLQSRGAKYVAVILVALIAVALWVGPAMFLMSDGVGS